MAVPSRHLLCLTQLRKHRAGFKKDAEDVMEPLMCLGFSSGIQFYQETKVLVGLSAERNPGAVWLGGGCGGCCAKVLPPSKTSSTGLLRQITWNSVRFSAQGSACLVLIPWRKEREATGTLKYKKNQQKLNVTCKWLIKKPTKLIPVPHLSVAHPKAS